MIFNVCCGHNHLLFYVYSKCPKPVENEEAVDIKLLLVNSAAANNIEIDYNCNRHMYMHNHGFGAF